MIALKRSIAAGAKVILGGKRAAPASAVRKLVQLKGVATTSASVLLDEGLVWRRFRNRRQIGGILGFAPTPYDSGETVRVEAADGPLQGLAYPALYDGTRWLAETTHVSMLHSARDLTAPRSPAFASC